MATLPGDEPIDELRSIAEAASQLAQEPAAFREAFAASVAAAQARFQAVLARPAVARLSVGIRVLLCLKPRGRPGLT